MAKLFHALMLITLQCFVLHSADLCKFIAMSFIIVPNHISLRGGEVDLESEHCLGIT